MKPQCETAAECLRELARVMEQFRIYDTWTATHSKYVKEHGASWDCSATPAFNDPRSWQFAIAEVEGKPVFVGDELYSVINGNKYTATEAGWAFDNWTYGPCTGVENMSWNQPKPKTVLVEMLVEDATLISIAYELNGIKSPRLERAAAACKKALGKQ